MTVLTPTFNRCNTILRVYDSLLQDSFKDFEWLVIDDGSTDNTREIVCNLIDSAPFKIRYVYKENGGKHTALNLAYGIIKSPYTVIMDSDDEFTPNALQKFHDIWENISDEDRLKYWCISGRCMDSINHKLVGRPFDDNINELEGLKKKRKITKAHGEKCTFYRTDVLTKFPFPVYEDTKFVSEGMVWPTINKLYDRYCVNDIFRIYHMNGSDGLSTGKMHSNQTSSTYFYLSQFILNEHFDSFLYKKQHMMFLLHFSRCAMESGRKYSEVIPSLNKWYKKLFVTMGYPISFIWVRFISKLRIYI